MTADLNTSIRASRVRVPRSRGAASGFLLIVLGAWAALVPFIGPYLNVAYTPRPNSAWHWTTARGVLEVLPGALVVLGGLLLLMSRSRLVTSFGGWLAAIGGAWLIVGPALTEVLNLDLGAPDPNSRDGVRALAALVFFYGIGALILFLAALALGRLSVHSVRDVRAAERQLAADEAAEAEERRRLQERAAEARAEDRANDGAGVGANGYAQPQPGYPQPAGGGRHERTAETEQTQAMPSQPNQFAPDQTRQQQSYAPAPPPPESR